MTITEAILHLAAFYDDPASKLTPKRLQAISTAYLVLKALTPQQRKLYDNIIVSS